MIDHAMPPLQGAMVSWQWDVGDNAVSDSTNPVHEYSDTGLFTVILTGVNQYGCTDLFVKIVEIEPEFIIHMPNTFTPNGDGINDIFPRAIDGQYPGLGLEKDFEMFIYDRWGDLMFKTNDIKVPWTGKANNGKRLAQEDVYVWIVNVRDHKGKKHQLVGHVTLIR